MTASTDNAASKQIVLSAIEALSRGEYERYLAHLAQDVRFYTIGTTRYSGLVIGRDKVWSEILGKTSQSIGEGGYREEIVRVVAEGEVVAVQSRGYEKTTNGDDYNNEYACFYVVRDGLIAEMSFYLDTELLSRSEK
ncbi:nuclear transport factor 2 family protein [Sphingobium sp. YR768]|uniref:nuclear transport factor 2 family protein n=1 Tax=Sphingobium sp. YR768 TaxID=1884365 RepID=UPI0008ACB94D|nr:nuclear transport factor 2 family protein [Sphingobium sp. YR768]SER29882.1 Ketosteroid isomerase-related protein [Sphingobium sp. YR768]